MLRLGGLMLQQDNIPKFAKEGIILKENIAKLQCEGSNVIPKNQLKKLRLKIKKGGKNHDRNRKRT